jgi:hypothetical protein
MNEEALARKDISGVTVGIFEDDHENIDHIFQDRYKGCSYKFWDFLQALHDNESNWNETGLSDMGKNKVDLFFNIKL